MSNKFSETMAAVKKAKQNKEEKEDSVDSSKSEKLVFFSARVPEQFKNHWKAEIAREGKSVKDVLIELLTERYGLPPG